MEPEEILIFVKGGMVQQVYATSENMRIHIIDEDILDSSKVTSEDLQPDMVVAHWEIEQAIEKYKNI